MKICSKCKTERDLTDFGPNKATKDGLNSQCKPCRKEAQRVYRENNREAQLEATRRWRAKDPEHAKSLARQYKAKRRDAANEATRIWREKNPEKAAAACKRWVEANRGKKNSYTANRHAALIERTAPWTDLKKIEEFYEEARRLTEQTGVAHHVDHIIPLQGERVSGLHVATNLQILTASANCSKGNEYKVAI